MDLPKILKDKDLLRILYRSLKIFNGKIFRGSLLGSFKILEDSVKFFQRSLRNICKDLSKIFAKILQDLQGSLVRSQKDLW